VTRSRRTFWRSWPPNSVRSFAGKIGAWRTPTLGGTTEVFIKASRGNFTNLPDTGIDDISARISYRPCWLQVPGS
jgi:hypothetical protein